MDWCQRRRKMEIMRKSHGMTDTEYNAWRNSLPNHCWHCDNFDRCGPNHPCPYNPKCPTRKRRNSDV